MLGASHDDARSLRGAAGSRGVRPVFAALDLGTNNCRLLIAEPQRGGFRVVDGFSRIVRLGEGLVATGQLHPAAMDRALAALQECAARMAAQPIADMRTVATQACRVAANGAAFLQRVHDVTGIELEVISPEEEARLSVRGCAPLIDPDADWVLVVDVGGGSTEISWVDARPARLGARAVIKAWTSLPFGVVTLAERYMEGVDGADWFWRIVDEVEASLLAFRGADAWRDAFLHGNSHYLGASGAVTSLAGVLLGLARYQRARVDGLWLSVEQARATGQRLRELGRAYRAKHGCIGPDRADLVVPGAAILEAVFRAWPAPRIRVADRGLREGLLYSLMARSEGLAHD